MIKKFNEFISETYGGEEIGREEWPDAPEIDMEEIDIDDDDDDDDHPALFNINSEHEEETNESLSKKVR